MVKLYIVRREDLFPATLAGQLPDDCIQEAGSLWMTIRLTPEQRAKYSFPISDL